MILNTLEFSLNCRHLTKLFNAHVISYYPTLPVMLLNAKKEVGVGGTNQITSISQIKCIKPINTVPYWCQYKLNKTKWNNPFSGLLISIVTSFVQVHNQEEPSKKSGPSTTAHFFVKRILTEWEHGFGSVWGCHWVL